MSKYLDLDGVKTVWDKSKQKYVNVEDTQSITGVKTFTNEIKTNQIANVNDNAMVRYKETENKVVIGGSTIPTTIMGSGDRPTYSKDGSDFDGKPLALLSDVSGGGGGTKLYTHTFVARSTTFKIVSNYSNPITNIITLITKPNIIISANAVVRTGLFSYVIIPCSVTVEATTDGFENITIWYTNKDKSSGVTIGEDYELEDTVTEL